MDGIACWIGGVHVYWYGLVASLAILAGLAVTWPNVRLRGMQLSPVVDFLLGGILLGLLCGRLFYVALHPAQYAGRWGSIFLLSQGGLSVYGAFAGFLLAVWLCCRRAGAFWRWLDVLTPALVLGLAIDQLGHFAFQAVVGVPFAGRVAEYVEYAFRPSGFERYEYFFPVALYQSAWQGVVFLLALALSFLQVAWGKVADGMVFLSAFSLVCTGRFFFGFFYLTTQPGTLHTGQWLALLGFALCATAIAARRHRRSTYWSGRGFSA